MNPDWFVPGGMVVATGVTMRLRPPESFRRDMLVIPRTPPSMNENRVRSHWYGFHKHKKSWQAEIEQLCMVASIPRGNQRAIAGAIMRFPARAARRDPLNFATVVNKACGDALVNGGWIPDDDSDHFFFGGVEFEEEPGPARTRLFVFTQPQEEG